MAGAEDGSASKKTGQGQAAADHLNLLTSSGSESAGIPNVVPLAASKAACFLNAEHPTVNSVSGHQAVGLAFIVPADRDDVQIVIGEAVDEPVL
jgi:hypothetical protein